MATIAPLSIRPAGPEDDGAILEAFRRLFRGSDGEQRSGEEWRWRYGVHPLGRRAMIARDMDGRVWAHYAGLPQRARMDGAPALHLQVVDSFCDPVRRGGLARGGLFSRVGQAFADAFVGPAEIVEGREPQMASFLWGLPVLPAWRSGRDHLGYGSLRQMLLLVADAEALKPGYGGGGALELVELAGGEQIPESMDELALRAMGSPGAGGPRAAVLRDRSWMQWRYRERPGVDYAVALVHRAGRPLGAAVARVGELDGRRGLFLCEWIVPAPLVPAPLTDRAQERDRVRSALLCWARERARAAGQAEIIAHLGERAAEFGPLQAAGFRVHATGRTVAGRSFVPRRDLTWFADHLEVSLGDTDLV